MVSEVYTNTSLVETHGTHHVYLTNSQIILTDKEIGIKFQKEAGKFLEIDIRLLNIFKKTHSAYRNTRCDHHECNKHVSTL